MLKRYLCFSIISLFLFSAVQAAEIAVDSAGALRISSGKEALNLHIVHSDSTWASTDQSARTVIPEPGYPRAEKPVWPPTTALRWENLAKFELTTGQAELNEIISLSEDRRQAEVEFVLDIPDKTPPNILILSMNLPVATYAGRYVNFDGRDLKFGSEFDRAKGNPAGRFRSIEIPLTEDRLVISGDIEAEFNDARGWNPDTRNPFWNLRLRFRQLPGQPGRWSFRAKLELVPQTARLAVAVPKAPEKPIVFSAGGDWRVTDMRNLLIRPGSALDLSRFLEPGPAGQHGFAVIGKDGSLEFEQQPGVTRRLNGFALAYGWPVYERQRGRKGFSMKHELAELARQIRLTGYDFVRFFDALGGQVETPIYSGKFDEEKWDLMQFFFAELKKQGVYLYIDISMDYDSGAKAEMMVGLEERRKIWMRHADLLTRVNPYTGLALVDDPALIAVMIYNEQSTGSKIATEPGILAKLKPEIREGYTRLWRKYLTEKYGTPERLADWNEPAFKGQKDFSQTPLVHFNSGNRRIHKEFHLFLTELSRECDVWCESYLRKIGFKGLVSNYNSNPDIGAHSVRYRRSQIISQNTHTFHTSAGYYPGSTIQQHSSLEDVAYSWNYAAPYRFADRPITWTELSHSFWNRYRYESFLYAAYGAFNNWTGLLWHTDNILLDGAGMEAPQQFGVDNFRAAVSPVARAVAALSFFLFHRGDVQPAKHRVELALSNDYVNANSKESINMMQRRISLLTGFAITFPELTPASGVPQISGADVTMAPDTGATVIDGQWFSTSKSAGGTFSLDAFVADLKKRGILKPGNISDPDKGIYQTETGEITLYARQKMLTVVTPRTEAIAMTAGSSKKLGMLEVTGTSANAMVSAVSLDNKPLRESSRMLFLYATREANTEMKVSSDETTLHYRGHGPVLLKTGKLSCSIAHPQAEKFSLYALGYDGERREKLPVKARGGKLEINFDTAALKTGPTTFFELVME